MAKRTICVKNLGDSPVGLTSWFQARGLGIESLHTILDWVSLICVCAWVGGGGLPGKTKQINWMGKRTMISSTRDCKHSTLLKSYFITCEYKHANLQDMNGPVLVCE